jgi:hypothetical protein
MAFSGKRTEAAGDRSDQVAQEGLPEGTGRVEGSLARSKNKFGVWGSTERGEVRDRASSMGARTRSIGDRARSIGEVHMNSAPIGTITMFGDGAD